MLYFTPMTARRVMSSGRATATTVGTVLVKDINPAAAVASINSPLRPAVLYFLSR